MADDEEVVFDREDIAAARGGHEKSQLTCNKLLVTVVLCAALFGLGLVFALPGPTLLDLEENTGAHNGTVSFIFTGRSVGYLLGSIIGGVLFDYVNQALLLFLSMLVTSVATGFAPTIHRLVGLAALIALQGVSMGFLDTGGNLLCLETWGRDNGPHLQALHFSFGFGAFLAPLIAKPFLSGSLANTTSANVPLTNPTMLNTTPSTIPSSVPLPSTTLISSKTSYISTALSTAKKIVRRGVTATTVPSTVPSEVVQHSTSLPVVAVSYLMIAVFVGIVSFGFLVIYWCNRKSGSGTTRNAETLRSEYVVRKERMGFRIQMMVLLFFFYFMYVGAEVTYGSLVSKFAVQHLGFSKEQAALIASVFWGSFAVGRLLAIFLSRHFSPTLMLVADLALSTVSLFALALVLRNENAYTNTAFCILSSTLGLGLSSIFPTGISWVERYMKVTGRAAAVFVVGSALGEMVLPVVTGFLVEVKSPLWLVYVLLIVTFFSIVIFVVMLNLACSVGERYTKLATGDEDSLPLTMAEDGVVGSSGDYPNGRQDGPDRQKRVTFDLNSASSQLGGREGAGKNSSILKIKRPGKKD